jgi:hypothetical protein
MPTDATLTKTERNAVLQALSKYKFDLREFEWKDIQLNESDVYAGRAGFNSKEFTGSKLVHVPTEYYFAVGGYSVISCPGPKGKVQQESHNGDTKVKDGYLETWIKRLRDEVDAPDLWERILKSKKLADLPVSPEVDNRPFSKKEQEYIAKHLQEIKRYMISTQDLNAEMQRAIESRIDYLIEASERMGRKDWHMTLMGIVATLVIAAVVTPERAQELFRMIANAFLPLFQSLLQLGA